MKWNEQSNALLKKMYGTVDQKELIAALKNIGVNVNWKAIQIQAYYLGLVRYGYGGRMGEPRYGMDKDYCPACNQFIFKEKVKEEKCPYCGGRVRDPGINSPKRRKTNVPK